MNLSIVKLQFPIHSQCFTSKTFFPFDSVFQAALGRKTKHILINTLHKFVTLNEMASSLLLTM